MTRLYFLYKIGNLDTGTQTGKAMCRHTERTPYDNECRHWSDGSKSQGMPKADCNKQN